MPTQPPPQTFAIGDKVKLDQRVIEHVPWAVKYVLEVGVVTATAGPYSSPENPTVLVQWPDATFLPEWGVATLELVERAAPQDDKRAADGVPVLSPELRWAALKVDILLRAQAITRDTTRSANNPKWREELDYISRLMSDPTLLEAASSFQATVAKFIRTATTP